jgi:sulfur-carrier protein adenylyltransferase/sulfurtransferase
LSDASNEKADRLGRYLDRLRQRVRKVSSVQARDMLGEGALIIDIRESWETIEGTIPGALLIERGMLELDIGQHVPETDRTLILMCAGGDRSAMSTEALSSLGYEQVFNLEGGYNAWRASGLPVTRPALLDEAARGRYSRHLALPEVGESGQRRLLESRVIIIGAGGLGSPAALYLAAAGVGHITLVDHDVVERSNLQRQILHSDHLVGHAKTESAAQRLHALNPDIEIRTIAARLGEGNAEELLSGHDVVLDGSDNFPTRYLLNDTCIHLSLPLVYGAVMRFAGQVAVFHPSAGDEACYRCLFPEPPLAEDAPNCAEAGVLGVMPGIIGTLQATETLKLLLGVGRPLISRLVHFDALAGNFRTTRLVPDPDCPACGQRPKAG